MPPSMTNPFGGGAAAADRDDGCFELTRKQRLVGYCACFAVGFAVSLLSSLALVSGRAAAFAVLYSVGNVVSLLSTGFMVGFASQLRSMLHAKRRVTSVVLVALIVATVALGCLQPKLWALILVLCVLQFAVLLWYSLSYIPFAHDMVKRAVGVGS